MKNNSLLPEIKASRTMTRILLMGVVAIGFECCDKQAKENALADTIYYGGDIITMDGDIVRYEEAVATSNEEIIYVGSKIEADRYTGDRTKRVDLRGKTMLPGFIDSHSHLASAMNIMGQANLSAPPVGACSTIDDISKSLQEFKKKNNIGDSTWIFGWGYDESQLVEKRHPTKKDLDKYFPQNPVFIQHVSGHMGVANSMALAQGNIDVGTPNPDGGMIVRFPGSTEPSGLLQEMALRFFVHKMSEFFADQKPKLLQRALQVYKENGITTAQEGFTDAATLKFLKQSGIGGKLDIDVVSLASVVNLGDNLKDSSLVWMKYEGNLKFQGTKVITDGSPQGKTAFFTNPYLTVVPGCDNNCIGFPNLSQDQLNKIFTTCYGKGMQLFVHCNGDAAIDMLLLAHVVACKAINQPVNADRRTIVIHSNFVRKDQLIKFKQYNIAPSFFTNHAYFWGDVHRNNLGDSRAFFLSPIRTADSLHLMFTNHTDYVITPINQLFTVWTAVNRISRSGQVIGPNERATVYQALRAITINAAYQYFEENSKGSIKSGKLADFVVLDQNPMKVDPGLINEILVLETIKGGKSIYKR